MSGDWDRGKEGIGGDDDGGGECGDGGDNDGAGKSYAGDFDQDAVG